MSRVHERAVEVNNKAKEYTLSHAVLAIRTIIEEETKKSTDNYYNEQKKLLESSETPYTEDDYEAKSNEILDNSHRRTFIVVDYLDSLSEGGARTYISDGGYIEIVLPGSLKNNIPELRKIMGHEIGHLALHFDELLKTMYNTNGSLLIRDKEKEHESDIFSDELARLRQEHLDSTR